MELVSERGKIASCKDSLTKPQEFYDFLFASKSWAQTTGEIYLSVEAPQFGLRWALGPFLERSLLASVKVEWKVRLRFFQLTWVFRNGTGQLHDFVSEHGERTVWLVIFFYTGFGSHQKKIWNRIPFSLIHYSSNFAYYWGIPASPQPANYFLGCFLVPSSENTMVWFWTWYTAWVECDSFLQKHLCWSKVKAQKQRCWMRSFFCISIF